MSDNINFGIPYETTSTRWVEPASTKILIDNVLTDEALDIIYPHIDKFESTEDALIDFGGGMKGLTVTGLLNACNEDHKQLVRILDLGNVKGGVSMAKIIVDECKRGRDKQIAEFYA